jgi:hypothetical protein
MLTLLLAAHVVMHFTGLWTVVDPKDLAKPTPFRLYAVPHSSVEHRVYLLVPKQQWDANGRAFGGASGAYLKRIKAPLVGEWMVFEVPKGTSYDVGDAAKPVWLDSAWTNSMAPDDYVLATMAALDKSGNSGRVDKSKLVQVTNVQILGGEVFGEDIKPNILTGDVCHFNANDYGTSAKKVKVRNSVRLEYDAPSFRLCQLQGDACVSDKWGIEVLPDQTSFVPPVYLAHAPAKLDAGMGSSYFANTHFVFYGQLLTTPQVVPKPLCRGGVTVDDAFCPPARYQQP